jgi:hypothetical protein
MFKKSIYILIIVLCADLIVGCQKRSKRMHCTTEITTINASGVYLPSGSIYGITTEGPTTTSVPKPLPWNDYAIQIQLGDSVLKCEEIAYHKSFTAPSFLINTAYALDPVVSAHTTDRVVDFHIINAIDNDYMDLGDTVTEQLKYHTYLLEHRHDDLSKQELITGFNNLLDVANGGHFYAGDYIPKLYAKLVTPVLIPSTMRFNIVLILSSGRKLVATTNDVMVDMN